MRFTKMHGIGNDYIYINCFEERVEDPGALSVRMSRPHFGVGSDGVILICPSDVADFAMRMYNSDGSESEMCGNGIRCLGRYVYERGLTKKTSFTVMTGGGLKQLELKVSGGKVQSVRVDMGSPVLTPELIPTTLTGEMVMGAALHVGGASYKIHCVSMGNPHCVVFVKDPDTVDLTELGPLFEHHEAFPRRTNTEFVQVISRNHLRMRVWERGAGETLACGTGACASLVAAVLTGQADRKVTMDLLGGSLELEWSPEDNHVYQEGPATFVYDGEWLDD
ncbi:MAG: diaminopimelate epimerase [Eubacteriales bacterium]|nr:diaminopimelate epimerase [Eubacteriales bacterium]